MQTGASRKSGGKKVTEKSGHIDRGSGNVFSDLAIPNSDRIVGAMSVRAGVSVTIFRLLSSTPGTSVKSMQ